MFEILLSRGYSENNFREDLKNLYLKLGIENKTMIFLFTDAHVAEESFLELINNMLTSGAGWGGLLLCGACPARGREQGEGPLGIALADHLEEAGGHSQGTAWSRLMFSWVPLAAP